MNRKPGEIWRYTRGGKVAHYLSGYPHKDIPTRSFCGNQAFRQMDWYGSGNQTEREKLEAMPECKRCLNALGRT